MLVTVSTYVHIRIGVVEHYYSALVYSSWVWVIGGVCERVCVCERTLVCVPHKINVPHVAVFGHAAHALELR